MEYIIMGIILVLVSSASLTFYLNNYKNRLGTIVFLIIGLMLLVLALISQESGPFLYGSFGLTLIIGDMCGTYYYNLKQGNENQKTD